MGLLLAFAPFLSFLAIQHLAGIVPALCAAAALAVALVVREHLAGEREVRILEAGAAVLFGALALCATLCPGITWSVGLVRLVVDLGLMLLVIAGVLAGKPFTIAFVRAKVTPERAATAVFLRIHCIVAAAWGGAFGVLALADAVWMCRPDWTLAVPVVIGSTGLLAAAAITRWLPERLARESSPGTA